MISIEKIKELKNLFAQDCAMGKYNGSPGILLLGLADYIIQSQDCKHENESNPEGEEGAMKKYLPSSLFVDEPFYAVLDFYKRFPGLCNPCTIPNLLTSNEEMREWCAKREGRKYYIQPKRTIWYLKHYGHTVLRKRATALLDSIEMEQPTEQLMARA